MPKKYLQTQGNSLKHAKNYQLSSFGVKKKVGAILVPSFLCSSFRFPCGQMHLIASEFPFCMMGHTCVSQLYFIHAMRGKQSKGFAF
jgi:hypothetical protein